MSDSNSREGTPDTSLKKSRRKPVVVHKIALDGEGDKSITAIDESFDDTSSLDLNFKDGGRKESPSKTNGNEENEDKFDGKEEEFIIPEGTVIVNPEPVDEPEQKEYKGPEWKATKSTRKVISLSDIHCTACNRQINPQLPGSARRHPVLKVLICKKCYNWYTSAEISQDDQGSDDECRWCGDGGNLICCDYCHNAFCKKCIKKNLGRDELAEIMGADDDTKWRCYVCDPKPLANLIEECTCTLQRLEREQQAAKEQRDKPKHKAAATPKKPLSQVARKSTSKPAQAHVAKDMPTPVALVPSELPAGSIPVQVVMGDNGQQMIMIESPINAGNVSNAIGTIQPQPTKSAPKTSVAQTLGTIVQNVSRNIAASNKPSSKQPALGRPTYQSTKEKTIIPKKNLQRGSASKQKQQAPQRAAVDVSKFIWEAPVDQYNVGKVLERTSSITDSLRMVMTSLKDEFRKSNAAPNALAVMDKRRVVAVKLRRAMGAFKKQISDIENYAVASRSNPAMMRNSVGAQKSPSASRPTPRAANLRPALKQGEVIELSDSSDEEYQASTSVRKTPKKPFTMKVRMGGAGDATASRKRSTDSQGDSQPTQSKRRRSNDEHDNSTEIILDSEEPETAEAPSEVLDPVSGDLVKVNDEKTPSTNKNSVGASDESEKPKKRREIEVEIDIIIEKRKDDETTNAECSKEESNDSTKNDASDKAEKDVDEPKATKTSEEPDDESDSEVPMDTHTEPTDDVIKDLDIPKETDSPATQTEQQTNEDTEEKSTKKAESDAKASEVISSPQKSKESRSGPDRKQNDTSPEKMDVSDSPAKAVTEKDMEKQDKRDPDKVQKSEDKVVKDDDTTEEKDDHRIKEKDAEEDMKATASGKNTKDSPDKPDKSIDSASSSLRKEVTLDAEAADDDDVMNTSHDDLFGSLKFEPLFNIGVNDDFSDETGEEEGEDDLGGEDDLEGEDDHGGEDDIEGEGDVEGEDAIDTQPNTPGERKREASIDQTSDDNTQPNSPLEEEKEAETNDLGPNLNTSKRTRSDIEAQRELHKALLDEEESSAGEASATEQALESSSSSSNESKAESAPQSSDEEFLPTAKLRKKVQSKRAKMEREKSKASPWKSKSTLNKSKSRRHDSSREKSASKRGKRRDKRGSDSQSKRDTSRDRKRKGGKAAKKSKKHDSSSDSEDGDRKSRSRLKKKDHRKRSSSHSGNIRKSESESSRKDRKHNKDKRKDRDSSHEENKSSKDKKKGKRLFSSDENDSGVENKERKGKSSVEKEERKRDKHMIKKRDSSPENSDTDTQKSSKTKSHDSIESNRKHSEKKKKNRDSSRELSESSRHRKKDKHRFSSDEDKHASNNESKKSKGNPDETDGKRGKKHKEKKRDSSNEKGDKLSKHKKKGSHRFSSDDEENESDTASKTLSKETQRKRKENVEDMSKDMTDNQNSSPGEEKKACKLKKKDKHRFSTDKEESEGENKKLSAEKSGNAKLPGSIKDESSNDEEVNLVPTSTSKFAKSHADAVSVDDIFADTAESNNEGTEGTDIVPGVANSDSDDDVPLTERMRKEETTSKEKGEKGDTTDEGHSEEDSDSNAEKKQKKDQKSAVKKDSKSDSSSEEEKQKSSDSEEDVPLTERLSKEHKFSSRKDRKRNEKGGSSDEGKSDDSHSSTKERKKKEKKKIDTKDDTKGESSGEEKRLSEKSKSKTKDVKTKDIKSDSSSEEEKKKSSDSVDDVPLTARLSKEHKSSLRKEKENGGLSDEGKSDDSHSSTKERNKKEKKKKKIDTKEDTKDESSGEEKRLSEKSKSKTKDVKTKDIKSDSSSGEEKKKSSDSEDDVPLTARLSKEHKSSSRKEKENGGLSDEGKSDDSHSSTKERKKKEKKKKKIDTKEDTKGESSGEEKRLSEKSKSKTKDVKTKDIKSDSSSEEKKKKSSDSEDDVPLTARLSKEHKSRSRKEKENGGSSDEGKSDDSNSSTKERKKKKIDTKEDTKGESSGDEKRLSEKSKAKTNDVKTKGSDSSSSEEFPSVQELVRKSAEKRKSKADKGKERKDTEKERKKSKSDKSPDPAHARRKLLQSSSESGSEDENKENREEKAKQEPKAKQKKLKVKESTKVKVKREKHGSDFDSDLEREIERLSKDPVKSKKKSRDKEKKYNKKALCKKHAIRPCKVRLEKCREAEKALKQGRVNVAHLSHKTGRKQARKEKRGMRQKLVDTLSSGEDAAEYDEEDELQLSGVNGDTSLDAVVQNGEVSDRGARTALLADSSDEQCSSDSDVDRLLAAKIKDKKSKPRSGVRAAAGSSQEDDDQEEESDGEVEEEERRRTDAWKRDQLLTASLSSESDFDTPQKRRKKGASSDEDDAQDEDAHAQSSSDDSEVVAPGKKRKRGKAKQSDSDFEVNEDGEVKVKTKGKGKKRRRIKKMASSDSDAELRSENDDENEDMSDSEETKGKGRKHIRKIMKDKKVSVETKTAAKMEEERRKRIEERQSLYNQVDEDDVNSPTKAKITTKLVLDFDDDKEPLVEVYPTLIRKLKQHQVEAVKFMWDCCVEDLERLKNDEGSGCILAHCMGLGKTLSVITFAHTLMNHEDLTGVSRVLVVCPLNTVLNWYNEWHRWVDKKVRPEIYEMSKSKDAWARADTLLEWHTEGGVLVMGYEMYRNLASLRNIRKKKQKEIITKCLVDPGPDLIVCDEGHVLKNVASALSKTVNTIKTRRRIVLTGTPLQNNLAEYHCMVDFVKPKLLGTKKEFLNRFVNPITNGQHKDSTTYDVKLMKKRAHILHETLAGCVQRKDYNALTKFLMPKHEYVISIRLSENQRELYRMYLEIVGRGPLDGEKMRSAQLFKDYQYLMRIWTHPWILKLQEVREENKRMNDSEEEDFIDDGSDLESFIDDDSSPEDEFNSDASDVSDEKPTRRRAKKKGKKKESRSNGRQRLRRAAAGDDSQSDDDDVKKQSDSDIEIVPSGPAPVSNEWWAKHVKEEDRLDHTLSGKLVLLAEILKMCEAIGDKLLVFSQSLLSLDLIESFLAYWDSMRDHEDEEKATISGSMSWVKNIDYFRMDGSTSAQNRTLWANTLNKAENVRARLFLISTKAGSLGTNLVGANRVIVFDASWNPSHDTQSIFRVYRFGQTKPTYIYRFLAQGTMEEKIYERQVMKQSLSQRVVDEQQVTRHFTSADLAELYNFQPETYDPSVEYVPILPKDRLLAELLTDQREFIVKYHEHDSLLENKVDEDLTEEERKAAWEEFEEEKKQGFRTIVRGPAQNTSQFYQHYNLQQPMYGQGPTNTMYSQQYQNSVMSMSNIEMVAKAIYAANPGLTPEQLQLRVQNYVQMQMRQAQSLMQMQSHEARVQQEMAKLRQMQAQRQHQQQLLAAYQSAGSTTGASSQYTDRLQGLASSASSPTLATEDEPPAGASSSLLRSTSSRSLLNIAKDAKKHAKQ